MIRSAKTAKYTSKATIIESIEFALREKNLPTVAEIEERELDTGIKKIYHQCLKKVANDLSGCSTFIAQVGFDKILLLHPVISRIATAKLFKGLLKR